LKEWASGFKHKHKEGNYDKRESNQKQNNGGGEKRDPVWGDCFGEEEKRPREP